MLNAGVALWGTWMLRPLIKAACWFAREGIVLCALLLIGTGEGKQVSPRWPKDEMLPTRSSIRKTRRIQRIVHHARARRFPVVSKRQPAIQLD
jgi:hypothetical protein